MSYNYGHECTLTVFFYRTSSYQEKSLADISSWKNKISIQILWIETFLNSRLFFAVRTFFAKITFTSADYSANSASTFFFKWTTALLLRALSESSNSDWIFTIAFSNTASSTLKSVGDKTLFGYKVLLKRWFEYYTCAIQYNWIW